ncbi:MAG: B12-binding domain-containing protein, partial [Melioribacteraceae bacterium]|nr:B12-binding domain-containing protein [Melioribacteraceae bacterium]
MELLKQISDTLQNGDDKFIIELTNKAIGENIDPKVILEEALISGMNIIGEKFRDHEIFLPEVLLAARAMHASLDLLKPL